MRRARVTKPTRCSRQRLLERKVLVEALTASPAIGRMPLSVSSARRQNAGLLLVLYALLVFALFPGRFDADSVLQYYQGIIFDFYDWLSPLMALRLGIL